MFQLERGIGFDRENFSKDRVAQNRCDGEGGFYCATLVVGGDGVQSPIRKAMGIPYRIHPYENGYMTAVIHPKTEIELAKNEKALLDVGFRASTILTQQVKP